MTMNVPVELLFGLLLVMVAIWFALILWLFKRLRLRHPSVFESLGSPSLFWNNSPRNNLRFLGFLFGSEPRQLQDQTIVRVCVFMRVFLAAYVILFIVLWVTSF
jgi:hypothetical protein